MEFVQGQCPRASLIFPPYTQETYFNGFWVFFPLSMGGEFEEEWRGMEF